MQKIILSVLLTLNIMPLTAQSGEAEKPFRIGFSLGCSFTGYRDEVESPINRYLNAFTFLIDCNIDQGSYFHSFNMNFFTGGIKIKSLYGDDPSRYISYRGYIDYSLDRRFWGNKTFPGYLGGAVRTIVYLTGDNERINPTPPTGVFIASIDLHASQKWNINEKNSLVLSAGYPLLGYAIRPAYASMDEYWMRYLYDDKIKILTLGNFTSFHNYWAVMGDLKYHFKPHPSFSLYSGFGFEISRVNFPRPRTDAIFRPNAGLSFIF